MKNRPGIGLIEAFLMILSQDKRVAGYRWKHTILIGAIGGIFIAPFLTYKMARPYQGDLPPKAPIVKFVGEFSERLVGRGPKSKMWIEFKSDDGNIFYLEEGPGSSIGQRCINDGCHEKFSLEGFYLLNGRGHFWPTTIKNENGTVLLDQNISMDVLMEERSTFGSLFRFYYFLTAILWVISLSNAMKIQNTYFSGV
ncbi:hypothetical protein [Burkholderia contaminans]|uniref:hypothetical protein n=1 Tax=Burkholderia contaminans TaxID=488447 RepID=UPI00158D6DE6|nr:hypothetical protein [Burkholderia contaminans]